MEPKMWKQVVILSLAVLPVAAARAAITFDAAQDAYVHQSETGTTHENTTIQIKNGSGFARKGYVQFDIASRSGRRLSSATLGTTFFDTATGGITLGNNWQFEVYHLADASDAWTEGTLTWLNAPGNDTASPNGFLAGATSGGTFTVLNQGAGAQSLTSSVLAQSLAGDGNGLATIGVVRNTGDANGSYVHGFRSSEFATVSQRPKLTLVEDNALVNGEFETAGGAFSTSGWTNNGPVATDHASLVAGSNRSAFLDSQAGGLADLRQTANFGATAFMFEAYFATENGGGGANDRGFNVLLTNLAGTGQINLRVNGLGQVQVFDSGLANWQTLIAAGTIAFSADADEDETFTDETLNVHRLRILGRGWGAAGASYDVFLSGANDTDFLASALGVTFYQNGAPDTLAEAGVRDVIFEAEFGNGDFAVDAAYLNAVPAPAALPAGLAMLTLLSARRRHPD